MDSSVNSFQLTTSLGIFDGYKSNVLGSRVTKAIVVNELFEKDPLGNLQLVPQTAQELRLLEVPGMKIYLKLKSAKCCRFYSMGGGKLNLSLLAIHPDVNGGAPIHIFSSAPRVGTSLGLLSSNLFGHGFGVDKMDEILWGTQSRLIETMVKPIVNLALDLSSLIGASKFQYNTIFEAMRQTETVKSDVECLYKLYNMNKVKEFNDLLAGIYCFMVADEGKLFKDTNDRTKAAVQACSTQRAGYKRGRDDNSEVNNSEDEDAENDDEDEDEDAENDDEDAENDDEDAENDDEHGYAGCDTPVTRNTPNSVGSTGSVSALLDFID
jgi:hypothetical protein